MIIFTPIDPAYQNKLIIKKKNIFKNEINEED
jgi:hypothetical protein